MMPIAWRLVGLVLLASVALASVACATTTVSIEPTSLRAYNDVRSASLVGNSPSSNKYSYGSVSAADDVQLQTTDGRLLVVSANTAVYIEAIDQNYEFHPPLNVSFAYDSIMIQSRYRPPTSIRRVDVKRVYVRANP